MRKKTEACKIWLEICNNCKNHEESFAGCFSAVWEDTLKFIEKATNPVDKFSLATLSKDTKAIQSLYDTISLNDYQKSLMKELLEKNEELLLTLNPYVLDTKYTFLNPVIDELVVDRIIQDKLLSLDDYELSILKRITEYCIEYGVKPNNIISIIINNIGFSSIPGRNKEQWLNKFDSFFKLLQGYEQTNGKIDKKMLENIAVILQTGIFLPTTIEDIVNYNDVVKNTLKKLADNKDISLEELKENIIVVLFNMDLIEADFFVKGFNIDGAPSEYYISPGFIELLTLKMLIETDDIEKLKSVVNEFINNPKYEISLFNNNLMEENLLLIYAREFNKCKPRFSDDNLINTIDGIKFYDSGEEFYAIVKTLGVFSDDGKSPENYYEEWNNKRYRSHINAVSLIRNDNLAFAEPDGNVHIKLGFLNFDEKHFLGGGIKDINSTPDSINMGVNLYSKLYFPDEFINHTREWHNELDYERKNSDASSAEFKKNPDFIILDQEVEDITQLTLEEKKQYDKLVSNSIKAAKDFGNIPILVINREKIAKNEINSIRKMLDDYNLTHNIELLNKIIIKFNNNRNGCRGPQHRYIREKYFSNEYFESLLSEIDDNILDEHRQKFNNLVLTENKRMAKCYYDKTTLDLPIKANKDSQKRGGLNV